MQTICLNQLSWRSYALLCTVISACLGFTASLVLVLLVYAANIDLSVHLGSLYIESHLFSIVSVFIGPFFGGTIGFLGSLVTHPVFTLILGWFSGLPLSGMWLDSEKHREI